MLLTQCKIEGEIDFGEFYTTPTKYHLGRMQLLNLYKEMKRVLLPANNGNTTVVMDKTILEIKHVHFGFWNLGFTS